MNPKLFTLLQISLLLMYIAVVLLKIAISYPCNRFHYEDY